MKKCLYFLWISLIMGIFMPSGFFGHLLAEEQMQNTVAPKYLYKILALEDWKKSQSLNFVILSKEDSEFIHLSTEEQLNRITDKYWSHVPDYVILKIETNQLQGHLVFEANQSGGNKYYHLYDGAIPLKSILETKIIKSDKQFSNEN